MKQSIKSLLVLMIAMSPYLAHAECVSDDDCSDGRICSETLSGTCLVDDMGNEICEEGIRQCIVAPYAPTACDTDTDCPSHLRCNPISLPSQDTVGVSEVEVDCEEEDCEASEESEASEASEASNTRPIFPCEEGDEDCNEADQAPNEMMEQPVEEYMCMYEEISCESDSECPSEFSCVTYELDELCLQVACEEGEDCPEIECDLTTEVYQVCKPNEIECDTDAACPTDWSCIHFHENSVSCGESSNASAGSAPSMESSNAMSGSSAEAPVDESMTDEADDVEMMDDNVNCLGADEDEVVNEARQICVPNGLHQHGGSVIHQESNDLTDVNREDETTDYNDTVGNDDTSDSNDSVDPATPNTNDQESTVPEDSSANNQQIEEEGGCSAQGTQNANSLFFLFALITLMIRKTRQKLA
jgi:hypothetical protein